MNIPCANRVDCGCSDNPLSNYSSEDPDRQIFLAHNFGYNIPPPLNITPQGDDCTTFTSSTNSQADADNCAAASQNECETGTSISSPCDICQGTSSGVNLLGSFGFVAVSSDPPSDACCDPSIPAECCCSDSPGDPNPPNPPPGGPGNPGQPENPPVNPPRSFGNTPQSCTVTCPDGKQFTATIPSGRYVSISQAWADQIAHAAACEQANALKECEGGGGTGCDCITLCLDSPADFQVGTAPTEGEEKTFELVGGDMPEGLSMDSAGKITGTPTVGGNGTIDVKITGSDGRSVILHTCIQTLGITTTSLPDGEVDVPYAGAQLTAAGGEQPYTFVAESDMPTGLTLNPNTGQISGTPDTGGSYTPVFRVIDACGKSCPVQLEIFIDGISATITRVYCPVNASIYVDLNVTAWGSTTANSTNVLAEALAAAYAQAEAQLTQMGCACSMGVQNDVGTNSLISKSNGACSIPISSYHGPPNPGVNDWGGPFFPGITFINAAGLNYHALWDGSVGAGATGDVYSCYTLGPQDMAHVIAIYHHTAH